VLATIYNFSSKKYPGMDIFVVGAIFFGILFGAATVSVQDLLSSPLIWIVATIGALQVLFMNMINGAIKDIDHDKDGCANTLAIKLGASIHDEKIVLPPTFKAVGYGIEIFRSILIFIPFIIIPSFTDYSDAAILARVVFLVIFTILTLQAIKKLFSITTFERDSIRKCIGVIVIFMYATTPIMLSTLEFYIILIAFIPPVWFICSNIVLHKTVLAPKTM
jgi:hypothetical protein